MSPLPLLGALDMARFVARGFLRFDGVVPAEINAQFLAEAGEADYPKPGAKKGKVFFKACENGYFKSEDASDCGDFVLAVNQWLGAPLSGAR